MNPPEIPFSSGVGVSKFSVPSSSESNMTVINETDCPPNDIDTSVKIVKYKNHRWQVLHDKGDDVTIKDPKLKQGYLGNLEGKSVIELKDVLYRQDIILKNKSLLKKLKDGGEKLIRKREEITLALERAIEKEKYILHTIPDLPDINSIEWHTKKKQPLIHNNGSNTNAKDVLDSDDDDESMNPLELMAYHSSSIKKQHHQSSVEEEDPSVAIARELEELKLMEEKEDLSKKSKSNDDKRNNTVTSDFGIKRIEMLEKKKMLNSHIKEPFKPFRPISNPQPIPELQHILDQHKAQPSRKVQTISLQEAILRERQYLANSKLKESQRASEVLSRHAPAPIGLPPEASTRHYRDVNVERHFLELEAQDSDGQDSEAEELEY